MTDTIIGIIGIIANQLQSKPKPKLELNSIVVLPLSPAAKNKSLNPLLLKRRRQPKTRHTTSRIPQVSQSKEPLLKVAFKSLIREIISITGVEMIIIEAVIGGKLEEVTATMKKQAVKTVSTKNHTKKKNGIIMMIPSKMKIKIKRLRTSLKKLRKMTAAIKTRRERLMIRSIKIEGITSVATRMAKRRSTTETITFQQRSQAIPRTALPNNTNERNKTSKRMLREDTV